MYDLNIIKQNGVAYIDSREVAECIGKDHRNLLRDIRGYCKIIEKSNTLKFERINFFVESSYVDNRGREKPCFLLTKNGCELCANKLSGEKGVLFTTAYVRRFNELEAAERAEIELKSATPRLKVFNTAVRNVLNGFSYARSSPQNVMNFLRGAYAPFGISIAPLGDNDHTLTATEIARMIGVYSEHGIPHGHAVAAIIEKLDIEPEHIEIVPYGLAGISVRYDESVLTAVDDWIVEHRFPSKVPHLDFMCHIYYERQLSLFDTDEMFDTGDETDLDYQD